VRLDPGRIEPWRPSALAIDPWTVLRLARYRRREDVPSAVWTAARAMATRAGALVAPEARLRRVRIAGSSSDRVRLAGAEDAVAFVLTLGPALEAEVAALGARDEPLDAYLLDLAGWAGLETAVRALRRDLACAVRGARPSHRLGPGHQDWPLEEQAGLVALLDEPSPLVRLSEHGVLVPFKSISGLFALCAA
jgi:hypothetical protein